jgi:hypothetical protein
MWRRTINLFLVPVFTITLACSLAKVEITAPQLAKQTSAPCPFHKQLSQPVEEQGNSVSPEASPEKDKTCPNCLSQSFFGEQRTQLQTAVLACATIHAAMLVPADTGSTEALTNSWIPLFAAGPPPSSALPLRI